LFCFGACYIISQTHKLKICSCIESTVDNDLFNVIEIVAMLEYCSF
jgi:hypothetical protein